MALQQIPGGKACITVEKNRVPHWNGERPHLFKEYKRRIQVLAAKAALEDEPDKARAKLGLQLLSALSGKAWKAAQSISLEVLSTNG